MNLFLTKIIGLASLTDFWLIFVLSLVNVIVVLCMSTRFLQVLQLSGYKLKGVVDWLKQTKFVGIGRLLIVSLLSAAAMLITNVLLEDFFVVEALKYLSVIFYLLFASVYIFNIYSMPQKTPIKYTKRMSRLVTVACFVTVLLSFGALYVSCRFIPYFTAGGITIFPILVPFIVIISHEITKPIEKFISNRFVKKAKTEIASRAELITIGVTGSYGKTSVKNIIAGILAEKYKVCVSPFSYNTPLGLSKTILQNLESDDEIFIAEMGARNVGDISELCNMVMPNIGVITGIGNQHMATFGTKANLIKTKSELSDFVESNNGKMVFNTDSKDAENMYKVSTGEKFSTGLNKANYIYAEDIELTSSGTSFTLVVGNKKYKNVKTSLLGKHNVSNILNGVCVATLLNVPMESILNGISKLTPTAHRLALVPSNNALVVIDDAYNGSVEGCAAAIEVLKSFNGKKVVITPGLVELGNEQFNSNFELGKLMSSVCDYVIINGVINFDAISSGLEYAGFDSAKIIRAGSLSQAVAMLPSITNPGDVVLFENDLPDNYL